MAPLIQQIIGYIQLAMKAAPALTEIYDEGKALIASLFTAKLITKDQQDALMTWADAHQAAVLAGEIPPEFKVE